MNEPIQYREYKITQYGQSRFWLEHDEYTGDDDKRCDWASTEDEAKSIIDNNTIEEQEHTNDVLKRAVLRLKDALLIAQQTIIAYELRYPGTRQLLNGYSNDEVTTKISDALHNTQPK